MTESPSRPPALSPGLYDLPSGHVAAVVTHLERRSPPDTPAGPAPEGVALHRDRTMSPETYRRLFAEIGRDWLWQSRLHMDTRTLSALLADPLVEIYRVTVDDEAAGLLELDFRLPGRPCLAFLGLSGRFAGRGIGRWLVARSFDRAFAGPIEAFTVQTCTLDSPHALRFYQGAGFAATRRQVEIMVDPRFDGTLDRAAAPHVPLL
ncbi:GNAT family N-acetyltransferase [Palleronia sediminis]|uniref:GNAT family N-acetyltransferase n=1 Tax=Palleronia sediminis TaxID=2547833 RepID=A0A4R6A707_9RHOB|nr:GNAT family N-acetyltransferase [Palleronia sediminis]TDL79521.1 GNAT family N-acetyltransferase [Palleronia sediminis]